MMEEKKTIPYKVQKGNRPDIEEVISCCLDGDLKRAALDFAAYMRESKMPFKICTSTTRVQRARYKGNVICQISVYAEDDWEHVDQHHLGDPQYWSVSPNLEHEDEYEELITNEATKNILLDNIFYCTHYRGNGKGCNPNKACAGGRSKTILGKEIKGICWCRPNPVIKNPSEAAIEEIKKLLELERKIRNI